MTTGKTVALIVGVVVAAGVVMIASCAGILYMGFTGANAQASPHIEAMFTAIENGTFGQTYDTLASQDLRDTISREDYERMGDSIATRLGPLKSKTMTSFNMQTNPSGSFMDVAYSATFEKGDGTIDAKLMKVGDEWKFLGFHVNSPVFQEDLATRTCPDCGEPHTESAKFCPACGAVISIINEEEEKTPEDDKPKSLPTS